MDPLIGTNFVGAVVPAAQGRRVMLSFSAAQQRANVGNAPGHPLARMLHE